MISRILLAFLLAASVCANAATTWYVDNRLKTGSNNGTSLANAWRTLYDSAYGTNSGSVAAGDTIEIVAGSGPYYEATHNSAAQRVVASDLTFSAAGKTIVTGGSVSFASYTVSGGYIRVMGSASNDGQYKVASVSATTITVASSHALADEAPGARVRVVDISPTSSPLVFDPGRNGGTGNPIIWHFNGAEVSGGLDLVNGPYKWVKSRAGTNEWYALKQDDSDPGLIKPNTAVVNGYYTNQSAGDANRNRGTPGALSFENQFGYGDNDFLGFNTVYVRTSGGSPERVLVNQIKYVYWQNWGKHRFYDGIFSFGNGSATAALDGVTIVSRGADLAFSRMVIRWADAHGFEANTAGPTSLISSLCYWSGHRCVDINGVATMTANIYNIIDWGSHLCMLMGADGDGKTSTVNFYNNVCANEEAGVIDKKSATMTLNEGNNHFYPRMTAANGALGYVSTANWATTAATDNPASTVTTTNMQSGLVDPGFIGVPSDYSFDPSQFVPRSNSPLLRKGKCYLANGCVYPDFRGYRARVPPNIGAFQQGLGSP